MQAILHEAAAVELGHLHKQDSLQVRHPGPSQSSNAMQASWWYVMPADALELVRVSSLKTVKALQTVAKFFAQVCTDIARHR